MPGTVLYITYDGLTDPVGQSQITPYIRILAEKGYSIHILSLEKENSFKNHFASIQESFSGMDVHFHPLIYKTGIPFLSSFFNLTQMRRKAKLLCRTISFNLIHARSYVAAMVALRMKKRFNIPFLFDMRGFWVDERAEGKIWNMSNPLYKMLFKFYKKKEKVLFSTSDHIVSLTHVAKKILIDQFSVEEKKISVIPCAADFSHFDPEKITSDEVRKLRAEAGLNNTDYVLLYVGSIGTWYMIKEMLDFFKILKSKKPESKFLFCINHSFDNFRKTLIAEGLSDDVKIIYNISRNRMPTVLAAADACIFFIKPSFSKRASSPIKYAEALAMNKCVISNKGIGDLDIDIPYYKGLLIDYTDILSYEKVSESLIKLHEPVKFIRAESQLKFGLVYNTNVYLEIYNNLFRCSAI